MANCDNPRTGANFEKQVQLFFSRRGLDLESKVTVAIGAGKEKRDHNFDLGSKEPPVLVECKCHAWTEGRNSPSAKMAVWNEAMLYFSYAPSGFRKILVVKKSMRGTDSLVEHYLRRFRHLIPCDVELWEFDPASCEGACVYGESILV